MAQGLGTSMLQMGNIVKNPRIWIPATLASAVTGPVSTLVFRLECSGVSAGMGTCGLVGPLGILADMGGQPPGAAGHPGGVYSAAGGAVLAVCAGAAPRRLDQTRRSEAGAVTIR